MLDGSDRSASIIANNGAECQIFDIGYVRRDFRDDSSSFRNEKAEPSISLCWMQCK